MLRLRGEDRFALLGASLRMTIFPLVVMLSGGRAERNARSVRSRSIPTSLASAHFERHQIARLRSAGFVVDRDLKVSPVAGKIVGADEKHGFVVGGAQLQGCVFR